MTHKTQKHIRLKFIKILNISQEPISREEEFTFNVFCCFFCFQTKPLIMSGHLPVSGYTPGQTIRVQFAVKNNSGHDILAFSTLLIKVFV